MNQGAQFSEHPQNSLVQETILNLLIKKQPNLRFLSCEMRNF